MREPVTMQSLRSAGYFVVSYEGTGMLEIQRIDEEAVFPSDEEAVAQATKDGIAIIPVDELPASFKRRYLGWIDTPENREHIRAYCAGEKGVLTAMSVGRESCYAHFDS